MCVRVPRELLLSRIKGFIGSDRPAQLSVRAPMCLCECTRNVVDQSPGHCDAGAECAAAENDSRIAEISGRSPRTLARSRPTAASKRS